MRKLICLIVLSGITKVIVAQTHIFAQLQGSPINTSGWNLQGAAVAGNTSAGNGNNSELILCPATTFNSGSIFVNQPINLSLCNKWKAEFDFRMYDGTAADGIAFCFLDVPPSGFVNGGGLGIPANANGLKVCFDTWQNCTPAPVPKIEIRWGSGYAGECAAGMPTLDNTGGQLSFIRSSTYNRARIEYDNGDIKVYVNGTLYLTGYQQFNFTGYLGFTASTGGSTDNHSIKNVTIYTSMPPSEAGLDQVICPGDTASIGATPNPAYVYTWSPANGLTSTTIADPWVTSYNTVGGYSQKYYVNTAFASDPGCSSVDSVIVTVRPSPQANFIVPRFCKGTPSQFLDSSIIVDGTQSQFIYAWDFDDGITSTLKDPIHTYIDPGTYNVKLRVTSASGCVGYITKLVTVSDHAVADLRILEDPVCSDAQVIIEDRSYVPIGSITKVKIDWDHPNGVITEDSTLTTNERFYHHYGSFDAPATQQKIIRYTAVTGNTCETVKFDTVILKAIPQAQFLPVPDACESAVGFIINQGSNTNTAQGQGMYFGNFIQPNGFFDVNMADTGTHKVFYRFTTTGGCADTAEQSVTVRPDPKVQAGPDRSILENGTAVLDLLVTGGNSYTFLWTPNQWISSDTARTPIISPKADITYTVRAENEYGCSGTDDINIIVLKSPVIPNAFSPNNDGINDYWKIQYLDSYPNCSVQVFNRFGQKVFESKGYNQPWNGKLNNKELPIGVYYYIIDTKTEGKVFTGWLTILK